MVMKRISSWTKWVSHVGWRADNSFFEESIIYGKIIIRLKKNTIESQIYKTLIWKNELGHVCGAIKRCVKACPGM